MSLTNTPARYGGVSKTFHWLTALLIFTVLPLGLIANDLAAELRNPATAPTQAQIARAGLLFSLHKTLGVTIFLVALARILWAFGQPKPGLLNNGNRPEALLAETVHWLLYGSLVVVPLTGWIAHAATTGFAPIRWPFGQSLPFVPKSDMVAAIFGGLHIVLQRLFLLALALHVAGALKHHFIDRDATLRRMWPGRATMPSSPRNRPSMLPPFAALGIWAAALGLGAALGAYDRRVAAAPPAPAVALAPVQSQWRVIEGRLELALTQFGAPLAGSFRDWTAAIAFDDPGAPGPAGTVRVTIATGSLRLGSLTAQALGPDFLDSERYPLATFTAAIEKTETGYLASGPLRIRDTSVPVSLPFTLRLDGDRATMTGAIRLNRRDFGIGTSLPDDRVLGYEVEVTIGLDAIRAAAEG